MNKLLIGSIFVGALLTSCSLNEEPVGQLNDLDALDNMDNIAKYRNGFYNNIRGITGGGFVYYTDIQADMFVGVQDNGNVLGSISLGNFNSVTTDLTGGWSSPYAAIASVNYFLKYAEPMLAAEGISEVDKIDLVRYIGEAKWTRAYCLYYLMDHYCQAYNLANPDAPASGVPIQLEYDPTNDYQTYPGRSTLNETYAQIEKDLDDAYNNLMTFQESLDAQGLSGMLGPNVNYLNTYIVEALQARVALLKCDYQTAISKANDIIDNSGCRLCTRTNYQSIWVSDSGNELLFVLYGNTDQTSGVPSTGGAWLSSNTDEAFYIPAANALEMYDAATDIRYTSFFQMRQLKVEGINFNSMCFVKYPGNASLNATTTNELKNLPKPFRLSETYLILAEASAAIGDEKTANEALNALRKGRIRNYAEQTYSGTTLVNEIRAERTKELIGEGFRISDLRRWNLSFSRSVDYPEDLSEMSEIYVRQGAAVAYTVGDYRYLWPIPKDEMDANPQLNGEQNPGY